MGVKVGVKMGVRMGVKMGVKVGIKKDDSFVIEFGYSSLLPIPHEFHFLFLQKKNTS